MDPEGLLAFREANRAIDVSNIMSDVRCPTLVVQSSVHGVMHVYAREVAAAIPDARLIVGSSVRGVVSQETNAQVAEFLGVRLDVSQFPASRGDRPTEHGMMAILFTDIADSTALTEKLGDVRFREMSRALDTGLRAAIRECGGTTVEAKTLGDGVLATFGSAAQAIEGARRCLALSAASELGLHIGVHAGDVIREEENVFGGAVNIAWRICGLSEAGEILVSDVVRGMARSSVRQGGVVFEDRGEQEM
jgi:class 3 adenylate cyclase